MATGHVAELVAALVTLLGVAALTLGVARRLHLPFTVLLVVAGAALGAAARALGGGWGELVETSISAEVILFVFVPTLVFESAFNLDARELRRNLLAVLVLAVPGLALSTAVIGLLLALVTPLGLPVALLLGSILSATDPVAVVSLFRQLGAPARLTVLVEGESLFNDATSIVLARILTAVVAGGVMAGGLWASGSVDFARVFGGGIVVGWVLARLVGIILGRVEHAFVEITLTTLLAYGSFVVAEEAFHVSGVMAVVVAAITMGAWGRAKISASVETYLEHFWEYVAELANALIFLLVGLSMDFGALAENLGLLAWVVVGMLVSRAVVVYGLAPLVGRLPGAEPIDARYLTVMYWGGLRGAIALALVLSLPDIPLRDELVAVVAGAVLFTLLAQGLTIERLVHALGLDRPSVADRAARQEGRLAARQHALARVPELQAGGLFSARIAERLQGRCEAGIRTARSELDGLRAGELDAAQDLRLLALRAIGTERSAHRDLHRGGHLSEDAYRDLAHVTGRLADDLRHGGAPPEEEPRPRALGPARRGLIGLARRLGLRHAVERLSAGVIARQYEHDWARYQACGRVLEWLAGVETAEAARPETVAAVSERYRRWHEAARGRLDQAAEQLPEFVAAMQERLAERLVVHAEREAIEEAISAGTIPHGVGESILEELAVDLRRLRGRSIARLAPDPDELLRSVAFFDAAPPEELERLSRLVKQVLVPAGETIVRQGDAGGSLYLIARGVVRVSRADERGERDLATLLAGDVFGEMALIHGERRSATCRAVTPCVLHELRRDTFLAAAATLPGIRREIERVDAERRAELTGGPAVGGAAR